MTIYKCSKCDKEFVYKNDYRRHINRKNPCKKKKSIENLQCDKCNRTYYSIYTLKRHMENSCIDKSDTDEINDTNNDDKSTSNSYVCKHCKRTFARSDSLKRHVTKYCKVKSQVKVDKDAIYKELTEEINELKKRNLEIDELKQEMSILKETIKTNYSVHYSNINVIAFGQKC